MVNRIPILCFLLVSVISHGQSKRAINKQLRQELSIEKRKYDSVEFDYYQHYLRLEELRDTIFHIQLENLLELNSQLAKEYSKLNKMETSLRSVGVMDSLIPTVQLHDRNALNYRPLLKEYESQLFSTLAFREIGYTVHWEDLKINYQNESIKQELGYYNKVQQVNDSIIRDIIRFIPDLEVLVNKFDTITQLYKKKSIQLVEAQGVLQRKLNELEEEYILNGPKVFPMVYRESALYLFQQRMQDPEPNGKYIQEEESFTVAPEPEVYETVEEYAEFPGGKKALYDFLGKNLVYPQSARERGISGKCYLRFVISKTGEVSDVTVLRGVPGCPECDNEAVRVIRLMPNWKPAKMGGNPVNCYFNIPIVFNFTD